FLYLPPCAPTSLLFPYTTLFRSANVEADPGGAALGLSDQLLGEAGVALDALDQRVGQVAAVAAVADQVVAPLLPGRDVAGNGRRSEEHTSELQSRGHLVCRLLLE